MKMKHMKLAAKLLVKTGYATYWKSTSTEDGTVVAYWVCWCEPPENDQADDTCEIVSPMEGTLDGMQQAIDLENYITWNEENLWYESERHTMRPISAGQYCVNERRLHRIRYCLKEMTKRKA